MSPMSFVWLAVLALALVVEAFTTDFVAIWFFPAALISMVLALFSVPIPVQLLLFAAVGCVLVFSTRPLCKKILKSKGDKTNVDSLPGKTAMVTEEINNLLEQGEVKINGLRWSARAEGEGVIPVGTQVEVLAVQGVKLIVRAVPHA